MYIGRARGGEGRNVYGNPWCIGQMHPETGAPMTRADVIEWFEKDTLPKIKDLVHRGTGKTLLQFLKGKILVCFCKPEDCHGDPMAAAADNS